MFGFACLGLLAGYNVAFTLSGISLLFASLGVLTGSFDPGFLLSLPGRIYPLITREILIAGLPDYIVELSKLHKLLLANFRRVCGS